MIMIGLLHHVISLEYLVYLIALLCILAAFCQLLLFYHVFIL